MFLLTTVFSQFISNTATAVLVAPIAVGAAAGLGVSPYPLLMTVALGASTAFSTPMASPVNTLVIGPGGYRFSDFLRIGLIMNVMIMLIAGGLMFQAFGFSVFTMFPIGFSIAGGILALAARQPDEPKSHF